MYQSILRLFLTLLLLAGVVVTQSYVIGFEFHRFLTPSWLFLVVAVLLVLMRPVQNGAMGGWMLVGLLAVASYLGVRGLTSALPIMAVKDYPVFYYGVMTFLAASVVTQKRALLVAVMAVAIGVHCYQVLLTLLPDELAVTWPRAWGEISSAKGSRGVFGFFRHYNPYASYCGVGAAVLVGLCFIKGGRVAKVLPLKVVSLVLAIVTLISVFMSESRMGTAVTLLSMVLCGLLILAGRIVFVNGRLRSKNTLITTLLIGLFGALVVGGGFVKAFNAVSAQEGRVGTGDLEEDVMSGMRVDSMVAGASLWMESPLVGSGPRSYWVHVPRLRAEAGEEVQHFSDPEMVHNDYIQTLAEYGILGLVVVLGSVFLVMFNLWNMGYRQRYVNENWMVAPSIVTAALLGMMVHALGDFTPHVAAVFVQLCLVMGVATGFLGGEQHRIYLRASAWGKVSWGLSVACVLVSSVLLWMVGKNQILQNVELVRYDWAKWKGTPAEYLERAALMAEVAPDPILLEEFGVALFKRSVDASTDWEQEHFVKYAQAAFGQAHEMHPFRLPTLQNIATLHLRRGEHAQVEAALAHAFPLANNRYRAYRLDIIALEYLMQEGERLWYSERKASLAYAYFLEAQKYVDHNAHQHWLRARQRRHAYNKRLKAHFAVLEAGKIQPASDVTFFEGKGL